jgi:hypothetical protein
VAYFAHGGGASLFFTPRGVTFALVGSGAKRNGWAVHQAFVGGRATASPHAARPRQGVVNSFVGRRSEWQTGLKLYGRLVYRNVWPGIDVSYSGRANGLEYSFVIRPGADPRAIRLAYRGARALRLTRAGRLEVSTPVGAFAEHRPIAYQRVGGRRVPVSASFTVARAEHRRSGDQRYGFGLGGFDASRPVVIDPVVFRYAGFLGGSGDDVSADTAVDKSGNAYMTGYTTSPDFPATPGAFSTPRGDKDAFVAKVDRTGKLVYADYIGGAGHEDTGRGVAVDQDGNAYITGPTDSPETSFPVTVGPDRTFNGAEDAFVAKVNRRGRRLLYAGYIGGRLGDSGRDISVDSNGYAYVAGTTSTVDSTFPAKVGPQLTYGGGKHDGFVAKVDPTGSRLIYCSYIGGAGDEDNVRGTEPDASGNVYITGHADSSEATFPVTVGPDLTYNGNNDGYVGKINPSGRALVYLGYVGGSGLEQPRRIDVDKAGNAYIAGSTDSRDFPVKVGPDLSIQSRSRDAFVTKVNSDGTDLVYSGFIGGSGDDQAYGLDVNGGNPYVVGLTKSTEDTFPVSGGPDVTYNGAEDGFIARVNQAGTGLAYAGYIGGNGAEVARGVGVDRDGTAYLSGSTTSTEATFPTLGAPDASFNGGQNDAFLAKVAPVTAAPTAPSP